MLGLLAIVVAFIVYGSLYPFQFDFGRTDASPLMILLHAWPAQINRFAWRDAGVNVLLYFPLGLTAVLVLMRRLPRGAAALITVMLGVALSAYEHWLADESVPLADALGDAFDTVRAGLDGLDRRHQT